MMSDADIFTCAFPPCM